MLIKLYKKMIERVSTRYGKMLMKSFTDDT